MSATYITSEWSAHETCARTTSVSDKAVICSSVALRAPPLGKTSFCRTWRSARARTNAGEKPTPACTAPPSLADPSATHAVRSGVDECFVTNASGASARFVRGPLWFDDSGGHLQAGGVKPAFFAYFLCGGKESKCRPAQGQHKQTTRKARKGQNRKNNTQTKAPQAKTPPICQPHDTKHALSLPSVILLKQSASRLQ